MTNPDWSRLTLVFSMPRSQSQWLAWYFKTNGIASWHDPIGQCASPAELTRKVREQLWFNKGPLVIVDTGAIFFQRELRRMMPGLKRVYLFRNEYDIVASIYKKTGQDKSNIIHEQSKRMYRYAFDQEQGDKPHRMYHGLLGEKQVGGLWEIVTGNPPPAEVVMRFSEHSARLVDRPLRLQVPDHYKMKQLLRYKEAS